MIEPEMHSVQSGFDFKMAPAHAAQGLRGRPSAVTAAPVQSGLQVRLHGREDNSAPEALADWLCP